MAAAFEFGEGNPEDEGVLAAAALRRRNIPKAASTGALADVFLLSLKPLALTDLAGDPSSSTLCCILWRL